MHIVIAPDSFKESLRAKDVAIAIKKGFKKTFPEARFDLLPLGDGGEGTVEALAQIHQLTKKEAVVSDAFGHKRTVCYASDGETAMFEMASICGLEQIPVEKRDPLQLTTRGVGELIVLLASEGHQEIIIGVGGSATNDGGIGMAAGLGYRFLDQEGKRLDPIGASLSQIKSIDDSERWTGLEQVKIQVLTDVANPLCGPNGATNVFSLQKGMCPEHLQAVDGALRNLYQTFYPNLLTLKGGGAGGGMAAGLVAFANGQIHQGIDAVLDRARFEARVEKADLVIVGEGRLDRQSLSGKTPIGVARRTPDGIPVLAICGSLSKDLPEFPFENIQAAFSIITEVSSREEIFAATSDNLERCAHQIANLLKLAGWNGRMFKT
ncbi:glycerate kinase [Streptococcus sp. DD13]|uniref:glycerate kinase n=1 Tax=Streptococcus sp. DD13 TaxID=1777881 RepID=UPI0007913218|nr:glycerate kinase [Streptococcus sp. DD13]KXT79099.1 Glycerate kinase [Streptococcus sp. DD13]